MLSTGRKKKHKKPYRHSLQTGGNRYRCHSGGITRSNGYSNDSEKQLNGIDGLDAKYSNYTSGIGRGRGRPRII